MSSPQFTKIIVAPVEAINQEFTNLLLNYPELRTIKLAHPDYGSIQAELDSTQISIPNGTEYKINLHLRFKSGKIWHTTWGGDMNLANWCIVVELDLQESRLDASAMYSPEHLFMSLSPTSLPKSRCEYNLEKSTFFANGSRTTWAHLKYDVPVFYQGFRNFLESWTQLLRDRGLHYSGKLLAVKPPIKKSSPFPEPTAKHYTWLTFRWRNSSGIVFIAAPQEKAPQVWRDYCDRISTAWPSKSAFVLLPTNDFVSPVCAVLSDLALLRLVPTTHPAFQEGLQFASKKVGDGSGFDGIEKFGKALKAAGKGVSSATAPWDGAALFGERQDHPTTEEDLETGSSQEAGEKIFKVNLAQHGLAEIPAKYVLQTSCRLEWRTVNGNIRARGTTKYHQYSEVKSEVTKKQVVRTDDFIFHWEVKFQFSEKATVPDGSEQFLGLSIPQVSEHASSFYSVSEHRITVRDTSDDVTKYSSTDQSGPSRGVFEKAIGVLKYALQDTLRKHEKAFNIFHSVGYFKPSTAQEDVFYIEDCLVNLLLPKAYQRYSDTVPTLNVTHADLISPTTPGNDPTIKSGRLRCNHSVSANSLRLSFSARSETSGPLRSIDIALHTDQLFGKNATFSVKPGPGATSTNIRVVDTPVGAVSPALPLATPGEEDAWIVTVQGTEGVMVLTDEDVFLSVEFLGAVLQGKHKVLITENAADPENVNILTGRFTHPVMEIVV